MTEHHHNMRIEELPHEPDVPAPDVENPHWMAIIVRLGALIVFVPGMILALGTLASYDSGGGNSALIPVLLLVASGVMFRHARELDPDDRW